MENIPHNQIKSYMETRIPLPVVQAMLEICTTMHNEGKGDMETLAHIGRVLCIRLAFLETCVLGKGEDLLAKLSDAPNTVQGITKPIAKKDLCMFGLFIVEMMGRLEEGSLNHKVAFALNIFAFRTMFLEECFAKSSDSFGSSDPSLN